MVQLSYDKCSGLAIRWKGGIKVTLYQRVRWRGNAGEVNRFRGDIEPVHGCSVRDDHPDDTDVDAKRHGTGPFLGTLATI